MGIPRNRRIVGRALVSTLACAVSVGLLALAGTSHGATLSAGADTSAPEFAYSGDNGPGFWGEIPGWEACAGTARTTRQSPINIDHVIFDRHLGRLPLRLHETPLALTNNGHTIEEEYRTGQFPDRQRRRVRSEPVPLPYTVGAHDRRPARDHGAARRVRGPWLGQQGGGQPAVRRRQDQSLHRRTADPWFADEERRRSERPLADDQRRGRADQHLAVLHLRGIADDAAVFRNGDVVRPPRVRPSCRVISSTRSATSSATISGRCSRATSERFAARWTKTISVDTGRRHGPSIREPRGDATSGVRSLIRERARR